MEEQIRVARALASTVVVRQASASFRGKRWDMLGSRFARSSAGLKNESTDRPTAECSFHGPAETVAQ